MAIAVDAVGANGHSPLQRIDVLRNLFRFGITNDLGLLYQSKNFLFRISSSNAYLSALVW